MCGGGVLLGVRLLCNVWQHARMFVVVFHTDNHVLTTVALDTNRNTYMRTHTHTHTQSHAACLEMRQRINHNVNLNACVWKVVQCKTAQRCKLYVNIAVIIFYGGYIYISNDRGFKPTYPYPNIPPSPCKSFLHVSALKLKNLTCTYLPLQQCIRLQH